jgi:hypothetical protein
MMAHEMTMTLQDDEYAAIAAEAKKSGKSIESLIHEVLTQRFLSSAAPTQLTTNRDIYAYLQQAGITENVPSGEPDAPDVEAERVRLAALFGQGKPMSEMVIEDRGPY